MPWCEHYFLKPWIYGSFSLVDSVNLPWLMAALCNRQSSCCERLSISAVAETSWTSFPRSRYSRALLLSLNAPNTALAPDVCKRLCSLGIHDQNQACPLWKRKKRPHTAGSRHRGKTVNTIRLSDLGISPGGYRRRRPARKRPYRGGRYKRGRTIPVIVTDRSQPRTLHSLCTSTPDSVRPPTDKCSTAHGISYSNLTKIDTGTFIQEFSKRFKVMFLNAQSVRNKALAICDYIMQANVNLVFLCETWLRPLGDEADCAALTPPGFCLKSHLRQSGTGGGLAVLHRTSLKRNITVSTRDFVFTAFEIREVRLFYDGHTAVFLSVYRPPPSRQNKLTNAMFWEQFSDLLESYVSCDRLFVVGDLNVHFDKPSDPTTSVLNVVLDNLSLRQLVNVPAHRRGHTLDWLKTNIATDMLDLTVVDMLLSDHFVISFDLLLRKPVREKRTIIPQNIRAIDMHDFRTDVDNLLGSATQSNSTDPLGVYNTCLRQLLDRHAPLVTRTVTDRTSAPRMTLEIKQAKIQRCLAERKWRESGLAVHREIYVKQRSLVSNMISNAKKDYLYHKVVNCGSSRELFHLSSQMMGKCGDTMLPSTISDESLPDKFNEFFVHKIEEIRRSFDPDRPIPTNPVGFSGTAFAEFQLVTEDFVKTVLQEMPKKSCDLDPIPISGLYDCLDEIIPIVTSIMNKSLSSGIVPQCFKHALVKPLLKKGQSGSQLFETLPACFQFAILVKGTGGYRPETVFAAFAVSQPSRAVPVCLPKVSQH